ncbi:MAG: serine/threonine protein kinase [Planctomycetes bacterium]|nr:serine/threonine protein kinase [Planctomycetota bacterium]
MIHEKEEQFARLGVEMGLMNEAQVEEALKIKKAMADLGVKPKDIATILREKEYLSEDACRTIIDRVKAGPAMKQIAGFEIVEKLSQGAMGIVYKARQVSMDRVVALKVLSKDLKKKPHYVQRFLREARAVAKLTHKNIVSGIDVGIDQGIYYFAMEFVEGETLKDRIRREGQLPELAALEIALQMAEALECANQHGILHRDIKPDNIMITADGVAKLCDLGLARLDSTDSSLTQEGTSMGTPDYISPEQARGLKDIDTRTDIYSLGVTLYHMLTGDTPFRAENSMVVMSMHITEPFPDIRSLRDDIAPETEAVLLKMVAKEREERYQNPRELREDLAAHLAGQPPVHVGGVRRRGPVKTTGRSSRAGTPRRADASGPRTRRSASTLGIGIGVAAGVLSAAVLLVFVAAGGGGGGADEPSGGGGGIETPDPKPPGPGPANGGKVGPDPGNPATGPDEMAYLDLKAFAEGNPAQYAEILGQCDEFLGKFKESERVGNVESIREKAAAGAEDEAQSTFDELDRQATTLEGERRFYPAIRAIERFPAGLRFTGAWAERSPPRIEELRGKMNDRFAKEKEEAKAFLDQFHYDEAIKLYEAVADYGDDDLVEKAAELRVQAEDAKSARLSMEEERFGVFFKAFIDGILVDPGKRWDFSGAKKAVDDVKAELGVFQDPMRSTAFTGMAEDVEILLALLPAVKKGIEARKSRDGQLEYQGQTRVITEVGEDEVKLGLVGQPGASLSVKFYLLPYEVLFYRILLPHAAETGLPREKVFRALALFFLKRGILAMEADRLDDARDLLARAAGVLRELSETQKIDVAHWRSVHSWATAGLDEKEAKSLLGLAKLEAERARGGKNRGSWVQPIVRCRLLLGARYSGTKFVQDNRDQIQALLDEALIGRDSGR